MRQNADWRLMPNYLIRRVIIVSACVLALALPALPAFAGPNPPDDPTALEVQGAQVVAPDGTLAVFLAAALLAGGVAAIAWRRGRTTRSADAGRALATRPRRPVVAPRSGPRRPYAAPAVLQSAALETRAGSPFDVLPDGIEDPLGLP